MSHHKRAKTGGEVPGSPPRVTLHVRGHQMGIEDHTSWERPRVLPGLGRNHSYVEARLPTAGLVARFGEWYGSRGYEVTVRDPTPPNPRVVVDPDVWRGLGPENRAYVGAGRQPPRPHPGYLPASQELADYTGGAGLPARGVAILVGSNVVGRSLAKDLKRLLPEPVDLCLGQDPYGGSRIRVLTYQSQIRTRADITIFADDLDVLSRLGCQALFAFDDQHVFGFAACEHRLSFPCRFELEASLGTVIYEAPGPGGRRAPVRVLVLGVPPIATMHGANAPGKQAAGDLASRASQRSRRQGGRDASRRPTGRARGPRLRRDQRRGPKRQSGNEESRDPGRGPRTRPRTDGTTSRVAAARWSSDTEANAGRSARPIDPDAHAHAGVREP